MSEERKEATWEELPTERQEDILNELETAETRHRELVEAMYELEISAAENAEGIRERTAELRRRETEARRLRGRARAEAFKALLEDARALEEARIQRVRAIRELWAGARELREQEKAIEELWRKTPYG